MAMHTPSSHVEYDHIVKLVMIGDAGVGKSSIMARYTSGGAPAGSTIGVEFATRTQVHVPSDRPKGRRIKAQIWDTAGQERYHAVVKGYYRGSHGAVVVYDVTNHRSFDHLTAWIDEFKAAQPEGAKYTIALVGNKTDERNAKRQVPADDGAAFARERGFIFSETTAVEEGCEINIDDVFRRLLADVYEQSLRGGGEATATLASDVAVDADTAGQEKYRAITAAYYRGALGAVLVYSVTSRATFVEVERWYEEMVGVFNGAPCFILLLGNKADLADDQREVTWAEGAACAQARDWLFAETSALGGPDADACIDIAFARLLLKIYNNILYDAPTASEVAARGRAIVVFEGAKPTTGCAC